MGNAFSLLYNYADRIHVCDRCGYWTKHKSSLRIHKSHGCRLRTDGRFSTGQSAVTLDDCPSSHHQHDHAHPDDCGACEDSAAREDDEQLREAVDAQLQHYMEVSGEQLSPDAAAGLADLLVGILGNGERHMFCGAAELTVSSVGSQHRLQLQQD